MNLLSKFLNRTDFSDYDDFRRNAKLCVPSDFNFGFDVVDEYARLCPEKRALVWCNQKGEEKVVTFGEMKELSLKMCNVISLYGVKKGDFVMSMLNRRWEYWVYRSKAPDRKSTRLNSSHRLESRMPSSA